MAEQADFTAEATPNLLQIVDYFIESILDPTRLSRIQQVLSKAQIDALVTAHGAHRQAEPTLLDGIQVAGTAMENAVQNALGTVLAKMVAEIIGVEVTPEQLGTKENIGESGVGHSVADAVFAALRGKVGELVPGADGAKRLMAISAHITLHGWFVGLLTEKLEKFFSTSGVPMESIAKLGEELVNALGVGRLARVALRPLAQVTMATPLQWDLNKQYRPNMLGDAAVVAAFLRGDYTREEAAEELARAGYSEKRIDMLIAGQLKWLSLDDALHLSRHGIGDDNFVKAQLRAQGYDEPGAEMAFTAAYSKYIEAIHDDSLASVKAAYIDRRISDGDFETFLEAIFQDEPTRAAHQVAARMQRDVNTKVLSSIEAAACVKAKVLPIAAYRAALVREGYVDEAVLAKELLLETELDAAADVERLRKQKQDEAAAAQREKDAAAAEKKADAEAQAKLRARGSPAELARAAVRGLIPLARVQEALSADLDPDTVQIYLDDITAQRVAFVQQQQRAADAEKRNAARGLDLSQLRQAVLDDVLTLNQFADGLQQFKYSEPDAAVLVASMRAAKADHDAAVARRAQADAAGKQQGVNLATFEQLVRRGIKSLADYDAQLAALKFGDGARAAMVDLLQQKINEDAAARQLRADTAKGNVERGLSLDQARRAVILGFRTIDDFSAYLLQNKYSVDAQAVLIAELRDDVTQADAARHRRGTADAATEGPLLPLSTVARAARLSVIPAAQYEDALRARGYSDDDVAVEMDLLANEIADVQAARAKQAATDAKATDKTLTLAQLAAAVKAGEAPLTDYQARAAADGLSDDDVTTLVRVLGDELANTQAAKARRVELSSSTKPGDVALAVLEQQVRDGTIVLADYAERLVLAGLDPVDVDLLTALLGDEGGGDAG